MGGSPQDLAEPWHPNSRREKAGKLYGHRRVGDAVNQSQNTFNMLDVVHSVYYIDNCIYKHTTKETKKLLYTHGYFAFSI